jgi:hypothetical protein
VERHQLVCGYGTEYDLPTLVLAERVEGTGAPEADYVVWYVTGGRARIDHSGGTVLLDELGRRIDWYDAEEGSWSSQSLVEYEAELDSTTDWIVERSRPFDPRFHRVGGVEFVSEYECLAYRLSMETELDDERTEQIAQEVWVTDDVQTTREIYSTYRQALRLFDEHWLTAPVERPAGIIFRTRSVRVAIPRLEGESAVMDEATVEDIGYRLYPVSHFLPSGFRTIR